NAAYLPATAESTKVGDEQRKFSDVETVPGFIVYHRDGGLTDADKAAVTGAVPALQGIDGVAADQVAGPQVSADGATAAVAVPLFSAVLALGAASLAIYFLAKNGVLTLNGQSQGILFVLVIGAGTDYALLLISRYREELHTHDSRVAAMTRAWRGAAPAIGASAATVILGLLCLSFGELNSDRSLGPVCA